MSRHIPILSLHHVPHPTDGARLGGVAWYTDPDPYTMAKVVDHLQPERLERMLERARAVVGPLTEAPLHTLCPAAGPTPMLALHTHVVLDTRTNAFSWRWERPSGRAQFTCMVCGAATAACEDAPSSAHAALASWAHSMAHAGDLAALAHHPHDEAARRLWEILDVGT